MLTTKARFAEKAQMALGETLAPIGMTKRAKTPME